jgi:hypothetical protein
MVAETIIHLFVVVEERIDGEDQEAAGEEATRQDKGQRICKKGGEEVGSQEAGEETGRRQGEDCP